MDIKIEGKIFKKVKELRHSELEFLNSQVSFMQILKGSYECGNMLII